MQGDASPFVSVLLTHPAGGWHQLVGAPVSSWHFLRLPRRFLTMSLRHSCARTQKRTFVCSILWQMPHLSVLIVLLCRM